LAGREGLWTPCRRIEDQADAREAMELMRLHGDRIALGGGVGPWR
jgi:hypothetical protein